MLPRYYNYYFSPTKVHWCFPATLKVLKLFSERLKLQKTQDHLMLYSIEPLQVPITKLGIHHKYQQKGSHMPPIDYTHSMGRTYICRGYVYNDFIGFKATGPASPFFLSHQCCVHRSVCMTTTC